MLIAVIIVSCSFGLMVLLLLAATVIIRLRQQRHRRLYEKRSLAWEPDFFAYLEGGPTAARITASLRTRHEYDDFNEFITYYLKNLGGEEAARIAELSLKTGLTSRLHMYVRGGGRHQRRAVAAITLGLMKDPEVLPFLKRMLGDRDPYLAYAGAYGIACLGEYGMFMRVMRTLLDRTPITYEGASELLVRFGAGVCPTLAGVLRSALSAGGVDGVIDRPAGAEIDNLRVDLDDFIEISLLVDLLGYFRYQGAAELLLQLPGATGDEEITIHVLKAVTRLRPPGAASRIAPMLRSPNWVVRSQAARALGALGDKGYRTELDPLLADEEWWVRHYAVEAMRELA